MLIKTPASIIKNAMWSRVITLCVIIFFILLGDAILSFWVPNLLQDSLKSSSAMGLIISFSSIVGLGADLVLPEMLKTITVKKLLIAGIFASILFSLALITSTFRPFIVLFLFAMAVWGVYYEFLGFSQQQFISDTVSLKSRSGAWGILRVFRDLAYFLGPLLAGWLLTKGDRVPAYFAIGFTLVGFIVLSFSKKIHDRPVEVDIKKVNVYEELLHWKVLFKRVWPIIILSVMIGLVDAVFWTTGTVWTEKLAQRSFWGGMFLPFYTLPALFVGFLVAKWGVYKGKKKLSIKFFILAGILLALLGFNDNIAFQLILVFALSVMLAVVYPLSDGVYTDIIARMGRERKHMIGLSSSTSSLAYIVGPIAAGFIADVVGERMTFSFFGIFCLAVGLILLATTPKKLKLPQNEISSWEKAAR